MATLLDATTFAGVKVTDCACSSNVLVGFSVANSLPSASYLRNTLFGYKAGYSIQSGNDNTGAGFQVISGNGGGSTTGIYRNTAIGSKAMWTTQTSCENVAIGVSAMQNHNYGNYNVAVGFKAAQSISNGNKNIFVGYCAGQNIDTGELNIGIGYQALCGVGNASKNIGIGRKALYGLTTGECNIAIGYRAGCNITTANDTIAIGFDSSTSNTNGHTAAGNSNMTAFLVEGVAWSVLSDSRDKTNINQLDDNLGLNFIRNLRPVKFNFDFRQSYVDKCGFEFGSKDGTLEQVKESYGFIAQEMENVLQDLNVEFDGLKHTENKLKFRLTYDNLIAPIVKSLQQTIERLEYLESKV
jgi:hypothetical protein